MTNAVGVTNAVVQAATNSGPIDWTYLLSVLTISLTTAGTVITTAVKIFANKISVKDEDLRNLALVKEMLDSNNENKRRYDSLKDSIGDLKTDIERLKTESLNSSRSLEDLKKDYRDLVSRLDDLLKQLLEWVNN